MDVSLPPALGGKGDAVNPELLFAGGYAACFGSALLHAARSAGLAVREADIVVSATVRLDRGEAGFAIGAALEVTIAGVGRQVAEDVVATAHANCPYSKAIRGNVEVPITITGC
jgi:Ohr subfamily peroxiredoxin